MKVYMLASMILCCSGRRSKTDECPICKESRWKERKGKTTRIPRKVLCYFPLIPRL
uniref:Uncharacterized protein n=1 Tax=Arundo donax TaxID=35708 RepID=A0A0A9C0X6_ARUDO